MKDKFRCKQCSVEMPKRGTCPTCKIELEEVCAGCDKVMSECDC